MECWIMVHLKKVWIANSSFGRHPQKTKSDYTCNKNNRQENTTFYLVRANIFMNCDIIQGYHAIFVMLKQLYSPIRSHAPSWLKGQLIDKLVLGDLRDRTWVLSGNQGPTCWLNDPSITPLGSPRFNILTFNTLGYDYWSKTRYQQQQKSWHLNVTLFSGGSHLL